jgi:hypothetical protein
MTSNGARARMRVISFACELFLVEGNQKATLLNVLHCYCTGFVVHLGNKIVSTQVLTERALSRKVSHVSVLVFL